MTVNTINTERDNVLRRVQKLLAIAQDDRANPNEAAAAASQAEKIMRKFQIDHADVIAREVKSGDDASLTWVDCEATAKTNGTKVEAISPWAQWLAVAVANFNDCGVRTVRSSVTGGMVMRFYGYKDDTQIAAWTFEYLIATTNRLCVAYRNTDDYKVNGRSAMNSYRKGVSMGILNAVHKMQVEKDSERATTGRGLMVIKQNAVTDKFGSFGYGKIKKITNVSNSFYIGRKDGSNVDVGRKAVGTTKSDTLAIQ